MTDTERVEMQRELVNQLVHSIAYSWARPMPADLPHSEPIGARLAGVVHSLLTELRGLGGVGPHRLSPKGHPDVNLMDLSWSLEHAYPVTGEQRFTLKPGAAVDFLRAVEEAANDVEGAAFRSGKPHRRVVDEFLLRVCQIFESGYELVPLIFVSLGEFVREAEDVAPGLGAAFESTTNRGVPS